MERKGRSKERRELLSDAEKDIDRISGLPDPILCHILSFLQTKQSVATSIVARRWRSLWKYVPTLDFSDQFDRSEIGRFANNISRVLFLHKLQNIHTFCFHCAMEFRLGSEYEVDSWIIIAVDRNVQNLDIYSRYASVYIKLPPCLFISKTLVHLRLSQCRIDGAAVCLPSLKKLHLTYIELESNESLQHLLSGCPVIEELEVRVSEHLGLCHVSSTTLKNLIIEHIYNTDDECCWTYNKFKINAPALRYLQFCECTPQHVSAETLNSLIDVYIIFYTYDGMDVDHDDTISVLNAVYTFCNVKRLKVSISGMQFSDIAFADSRFGSGTMKFGNLMKLEWDANWNFLSRFLENVDNLDVLIIPEGSGENHIHWKKPQQVPTCLISHLTTVIIKFFMPTKQDFDMVRYLLKNAKVLKRMKIRHYTFDQKIKSDVRKRISRFPRGSRACRLQVS